MADADLETIAECDELIGRLGEPRDAEHRNALARAMNRKAIALGRLGRHDERLTLHREVIDRFAADDGPEMAPRIASALLGTGIALDRLERHEEAVAAFDAVDERFCGSADPDVRASVALALRRKAWAFEELRRTDDAIAAFAALADRFGDAPDPKIRGWAGQALLREGWLLGESGREEEALGRYDELLERFGADEALPEYDLACAVHNRGLMHLRLGRFEQALAEYEAFCERFAGSTDRRIAELLVYALADECTALLSLGRDADVTAVCDEALGAFDRHVAAYGEPAEELRAAMLRALFHHAHAVWGDGHDSRVVPVYESLLAVARPSPPPELRGSVLSALLSYGTALSNLGFGDRANALPTVVAELFGGDPDEDDDDPEPPPADEPPDEEIAALLAEAYASDAWGWFAAPDRDRPAGQLGARAVALYERTGPVIDGLAGDRDLDSPAAAAALLTRTVANGCAILARSGSVAPRTRALLPVRPRLELGIRMLGIDRWAADHGHSLDLAPSDEELELDLPSPGESPGGIEGFPAAFAAAVRGADIVAAARRSPSAAEVLGGTTQRDLAAAGVARAVHWAAWLEPRRPEAAPAAVAMMLLAQGVFAATWSDAPATAWFPRRDLVRQAVEAADVADWFEDAGVLLPDWLRDV